MNNCAIDFSPLFRSSIGYDHVSRLMETALASPKSAPNYPPYNIEKYGENNYRITMAVAGLIVHGGDPFQKKETSLLYLSVYLMLFAFGPGKFSVDYMIGRRKENNW